MTELRLIDANALLCDVMGLTIATPAAMNYANAINMAIADAPTIDSVPVVHGRWVLVSKGNFSPGGFEVEEKCSECGRYVYRYEEQYPDNYCPNCGAKMDGGDGA